MLLELWQFDNPPSLSLNAAELQPLSMKMNKHYKNSLAPQQYLPHKYNAKVGNANGLNFMVSRRGKFPQQAHWHLEVPQEQRNEKLKSKNQKIRQSENQWYGINPECRTSSHPISTTTRYTDRNVSPPDPRILHYEYEQEREISVWEFESMGIKRKFSD